MTELAAVRIAVGLVLLPTNVRRVRSEPLPPGIENLLMIVSGNEELASDISRQIDRPTEVLRDACIFFVEQILLSPESDHYRVLGADSAATSQRLRHNMALLMSWLHPDKNASGERAVFAIQVTTAWDILRNADKRAMYDAHLSLRARTETSLSRPHCSVRARSPRRSESCADAFGYQEQHGILRSALRRLRHLQGR